MKTVTIEKAVRGVQRAQDGWKKGVCTRRMKRLLNIAHKFNKLNGGNVLGTIKWLVRIPAKKITVYGVR